MILAVVYLLQGNQSAAPMNVQHVLPPWHGFASIVLVVNSFFTYAGVEVTAVHVDELHNPSRDYPKAIFLAVALVLAISHPPDVGYRLGDPLSSHQPHRWSDAGVQAPAHAFRPHICRPDSRGCARHRRASWLLAWLDGPSEGLLRIGREHGYLPPFFQKVNKEGIEVNILAAQGVVITVIALLYAVIPTISRAYWIFTVMATQIYLVMYVLMFISARRLRRRQPENPGGYRAPLRRVFVIGGLASVTAFIIGFVPPAQLGHQND